MQTLARFQDRPFDPTDWQGLCDGKGKVVIDTSIFLTALLQVALRGAREALAEASLPREIHRAADELWALRGRIGGAVCVGLSSVLPPLFSTDSEVLVGVVGIGREQCERIPLYWEGPTFTTQFKSISRLTRQVSIPYMRPHSPVEFRRGALRGAGAEPTRSELAQLTAYLGVFVRNSIEDWHAHGGLSDDDMADLNRTMRNAIFTGMFVISRKTRSARLQAELAQKISACVEGWGDEDIDVPKDLARPYRKFAHLVLDRADGTLGRPTLSDLIGSSWAGDVLND